LIEIINKQLLLQLVGYLCYWQMGFNSVFKGLNMLYTLRFFFSSKCSLFHNANLFGSSIIHILYSSIIHILYTGVLKLKKNNSGAKGLMTVIPVSSLTVSMLLRFCSTSCMSWQ